MVSFTATGIIAFAGLVAASAVTVTDMTTDMVYSTEYLTITSCKNNACSESTATVYHTVTDEIVKTINTTYCPLTASQTPSVTVAPVASSTAAPNVYVTSLVTLTIDSEIVVKTTICPLTETTASPTPTVAPVAATSTPVVYQTLVTTVTYNSEVVVKTTICPLTETTASSSVAAPVTVAPVVSTPVVVPGWNSTVSPSVAPYTASANATAANSTVAVAPVAATSVVQGAASKNMLGFTVGAVAVVALLF